ncbi:hypothetical protein GUITHDRAFT_71548 [Guillardia theta CCMP2712]|uniref:Centrosomal protein 20 n=1 Tax=Guillardia theta (strain CCMP2712) TaxID=905079 RepID=L1JAX3_GUITC|nr:hypothetical protein GUITHDRAFT_71548 [Guillardia theta CCMP2712]EKX45240.1 hypothetical protein GUITHDRAFT_71548 [Guillardia theta CCMP2712]|eukprot:XP_005832220.1 hypothetical protein GUITHDRAFT_71548 [Guillardia theta CCMP2712]
MSSLEELKDALRDTLAARGTLGDIQARIRAEIFNALEESEEAKPALSHENLIINELIREYLEYNHYKHTLSVLVPETGQPIEKINRTFLVQELGMREDSNSRQLPVLYNILARLKQEKGGFRASALPDSASIKPSSSHSSGALEISARSREGGSAR